MFVKKLLILCSFIFLIGCSQNNTWEYKEYKVNNSMNFEDIKDEDLRLQMQKLAGPSFSIPIKEFNKLGNEGWELVSSSVIIETTFPNFGNEDYHTGIKSNTKTKEIIYIFKRKVTKK